MKRRLTSLLVLVTLLSCLICSVYAAPVRIFDGAGLLTAYEAAELSDYMQQLYDRYGADVVIVTTNSLDGYSAQSFADDFYDYGGFSSDGVLLLVDMGSRQWHISTSGSAITSVDDDALADIENNILPDLADGNYYSAFYRFYLDIDYYLGGEKINIFDTLIVSLPIGLIVALIAILIMRGTMNTKNPQRAAGSYEVPNSYHLNVSRDTFLYSNITKIPKPKDPPKSSGGSSIHTGSSGVSHGGRGGRF